ncbi:protein kinase [Spirosoma sp. BT702]|uniref:Protein kinase n=1 Tax=Spirosoma profusum TaxID=2771354 RepID=A0A927APY2_9BACT|nr:serine/threonine-protein kinase [Spirosoma profusum]MBD2699298.1 protein kinase [Spirosoma profusum]
MSQSFTSFQDFRQRYPIRPNEHGTLLGSGSYGRVIKVEDQLETEWVAIKISEFKGNDARSLKAEVELAQRVPRQANIVRYDACYRLETDTGVSDFAIMKYYPDGNLANLLQQQKLTPDQVYDITRGILLGLQHLHKHRIVHRDFKPANILISRDNSGRFIPKIADFGLSKLVTDEELDSSDFDLSDGRGTPSYKAPEQIEGSRVSFNLDLWAFGVILYEMLTGEKPFRADLKNSSEQSVRREIEKKIVTVDLPARLGEIAEPYGTIIRRCLIRDIHERARKEAELLDWLDQIPQLMAEANTLLAGQQYESALALYEKILDKREHLTEAQNGADLCRKELAQQQITDWLFDARQLIQQQEFEQAKKRYERILQVSPADTEAARGLVACIEKLRPKSAIDGFELIEGVESTDTYLPDESTDMFDPAPILVATEKRPNVVTTPEKEALVAMRAEVAPEPLRIAPVFTSIKRSKRLTTWKMALSGVVLLSSLGWYVTREQTGKPATLTPPSNGQGVSTQPAESKPLGALNTKPESASTNVMKNGLFQADAYLKPAQQAYHRHNYTQVIRLANAALKLDPTRQDFAWLRNAALTEMREKSPDSLAQLATLIPIPESFYGNAPEINKPDVVETAEMAEEKRLKEKQEQQNAYDQLIDEGLKSVTVSNNKTKAKSTFSKAQALAKEQSLNMAKADMAYTYCLDKGKGYLERDAPDGAKAWFEVAQALKDTDDVRRKIRQCSTE